MTFIPSNLERYSWCQPQIIELEPIARLRFFVMITSLTEMLELPYFAHITTSTHNLGHGIEFCW